MPGVYDALTARIAARVGFDIVFISGYSVSAARLGEPDFGFLTQTEMADAARVGLPRLGRAGDRRRRHRLRQRRQRDAHGRATSRTPARPASSSRTRSGPRSAATSRASRSIPTDEHAAKIRAAADARGERDLFIVARTDARQPLGARRGDRALPRLQGGRRRRALRRGAAVGRGAGADRRGAAGAAGREHDRARRDAAPLARGAGGARLQADRLPAGGAVRRDARRRRDVLTELRDKETTAGALDA